MSNIFLDRCQIRLSGVVAVFHSRDPSQHLGKIERLHRDAKGLQKFLAVANGVKRRGSSANRADTQIPKPIHNATDRGEPLQILGELLRLGCSVWNVVIEYGMPYCRRLLQTDIFPQKLSRRWLITIRFGSSGVA